LEVAVALIESDGSVRTYSERLSIWPYRHKALVAELHGSGFKIESSTFAADVEGYTVVARRV